jgi:hypothetical protein
MVAAGAAHAAAREGAHARFQLGQRKRLGHVVVGAHSPGPDALFDAVGGREDQHRQRRAAPAQALEHLQAVHLGQAQVQDQQVELAVGQQRGIGLAAAGHMVHDGARAAQRAQQAIGQHLVVFGNQYAHGCLLLHGACLDFAPLIPGF